MSSLKPIIFVLLISLMFAVSALGQSPQPQDTTPIPASPAKPLVDQAVPAGWVRYQMGNRPYLSAIFPEVPQASAEKNATSGGVTNIYLATSDAGVFVAARFDGIVGGTVGDEKQDRFFKQFVTGFAKGFKESLTAKGFNADLQFTESKKISIGSGQNGFQQDMTLGPFKGRAQIAFVDSSGFAIVSMWSSTTPASVPEEFFKSFRITP